MLYKVEEERKTQEMDWSQTERENNAENNGAEDSKRKTYTDDGGLGGGVVVDGYSKLKQKAQYREACHHWTFEL